MDDKEKPIKDFSDELQEWLDSDQKKTIAGLEEVFGEKSFAMMFFLLLSASALPLPTGGLTNIFEAFAMFLALQLIAQRRTIWLPKRWRSKKLGSKMQTKTLPYLIKKIKKVEKRSRPRMSKFIESRISRTCFGIIVFALSLVAFFAPPFSGLDTLPALGVLGISLGVLFGDVVIVMAGAAIGALGAVLSIGFGTVVVKFISGLF
ncbi:MAG TPA: exopolysaccharide biosynthesis protein [Acidimicrobiia bacterium]|nr:exopolysaccharide biosynthesis protein [Acidimicrobiia bacterium]